jgi:uncharacterized membrane protein YhaH (DUF805 family)
MIAPSLGFPAVGFDDRRGDTALNLQEAVRSVLGQYVGFTGRARRSEYWYWTLAVVIGVVICIVLTAIAKIFLVLYILFLLAVFLPGLSVLVRRLHDTGKSGWWVFIGLVPFVGGIVLLVFACLDSTPGTNQYGPSPKEIAV